MLNTAIELYNDEKNRRRVPIFSLLLFARDTSSSPCQLMHNHLNQIGHSGGLEQVRRDCSYSVFCFFCLEFSVLSGLRNHPAFVSLSELNVAWSFIGENYNRTTCTKSL